MDNDAWIIDAIRLARGKDKKSIVLDELERQEQAAGLVGLCNGGGMATIPLTERVR